MKKDFQCRQALKIAVLVDNLELFAYNSNMIGYALYDPVSEKYFYEQRYVTNIVMCAHADMTNQIERFRFGNFFFKNRQDCLAAYRDMICRSHQGKFSVAEQALIRMINAEESGNIIGFEPCEGMDFPVRASDHLDCKVLGKLLRDDPNPGEGLAPFVYYLTKRKDFQDFRYIAYNEQPIEPVKNLSGFSHANTKVWRSNIAVKTEEQLVLLRMSLNLLRIFDLHKILY